MKKKQYSLCEAVADIAYAAGVKKYYGGDSRADIAQFISWAEEFEKKHKGVEWGVGDAPDYIDTIDAFLESKLTDTKKEQLQQSFGTIKSNVKISDESLRRENL